MCISKENQRYGHWEIENKVLKLLNSKSYIFGDMNFHMEFINYTKRKILDISAAKRIISNRNIGIISCFDVSKFLSKHKDLSNRIKKYDLSIINSENFNTILNTENPRHRCNVTYSTAIHTISL